MSGILNAFGIDNGFTQYIDPRRGQLLGLASGLLGSPTLAGGLSQGFANAAQAKPADDAYATQQKAEAERLASINKTAAWLKQNYPQFSQLPAEQGFQLAAQLQAKAASASAPADPASVAEYKFYANQEVAAGRNPDPYNVWRQGSNQTVRAGVGQPIFGKNLKTGRIEPWQSMTDGTMVNTANKEANPSDYSFDPAITAQQRASGTAQGKIGGTTEANIPLAAQTAENALGTIQKLRSDPQGILESYGTYGVGPVQIPAQWGLTVPGSHKADFQATLSQAKGQAFLQAYSTLRGAGAITDVEGQKAGQAVARLQDPNISVAAFNSALDDYESVIKAGYARLQQIAAQSGGADPGSLPQLGGSGDPELDQALQQYGGQ